MSVGFFLSVHSSYTENGQAAADSFVRAINDALLSQGLGRYVDPEEPPNAYVGPKFGRSSLDHHSASCLVDVAELEPTLSHLELIAFNPYRVAFLPLDFPSPLETTHREWINDVEPALWIGSAPRLLRELQTLSSRLGISCPTSGLTDDLAAQIDNLERLAPGDPQALVEDTRTAWLLLYEGARLAITHGTALSLAG
ncbi:MAG TPA: hypothetical protein VER96_29050 [Polyangiaceae bacterium]|nr:hypothetical protein [Polyangiaceae bacterium]